MGDFSEVLLFSLMPLFMTISVSLLTPVIGAVLSIRNEIMLALALSIVGQCRYRNSRLCGIGTDQNILLYLFATLFTLVVVSLQYLFDAVFIKGSLGLRVYLLQDRYSRC